uniref:Uncharacterized protein n=1 Tax=Strongyloides venezuelensis TaxID=75913 RepID=A0A0K0F0K1_STRVS
MEQETYHKEYQGLVYNKKIWVESVRGNRKRRSRSSIREGGTPRRRKPFFNQVLLQKTIAAVEGSGFLSPKELGNLFKEKRRTGKLTENFKAKLKKFINLKRDVVASGIAFYGAFINLIEDIAPNFNNVDKDGIRNAYFNFVGFHDILFDGLEQTFC